jgi:membrane-associated PAP2 superfamily phosphatase
MVVATISIAVRFLDLDLSIEKWFWSPADGWRLAHTGIVQLFYHYGTIPGLVVGLGGLLVWATSFFARHLRPARLFAGFLALALITGPGLMVNILLKEHYGRPRPSQVTEFGGDHQRRLLWEPTFDENERSFPSGHASMGFFWFAPAVYYWRRHRRRAWGFAVLALLHGSAMGLGRMAQGAHWPSDILWSAAIVYASCWVLGRTLNLYSSWRPAAEPIEPLAPCVGKALDDGPKLDAYVREDEGRVRM